MRLNDILVDEDIKFIILLINITTNQEIDKFYYYRNRALIPMTLVIDKFLDLYKLIIQIKKINYSDEIIEKNANDILTLKGYLNSWILYFNDGTVINFMKKYVKLSLLRKKSENTIYNADLTNDEIYNLYNKIIPLKTLTNAFKDVIIDEENQTNKFNTIRSSLTNYKPPTSDTVYILIEELNKLDNDHN